ncbi:MAG TPA: phosphohistidine phosphatase SixA [Candidatus Baltobacteraceae bacterium]|nr:phosphohistidine phosphatase SixA [Candidatus Baltobacteraceae bacterium]
MRCYFLRHGLAGDREDWQGDDSERPLTAEGIEKMGREAKTIAALKLQLDAIVTSPLTRARQTAEIVAKELKLRDRLVEDDNLGLAFDLEHLTNVLEKHAGANSIMLVGHDPSMSETIGQLIGNARVEMKKGSLACVEIATPSSRNGVLTFLLPPKVLAGGR